MAVFPDNKAVLFTHFICDTAALSRVLCMCDAIAQTYFRGRILRGTSLQDKICKGMSSRGPEVYAEPAPSRQIICSHFRVEKKKERFFLTGNIKYLHICHQEVALK